MNYIAILLIILVATLLAAQIAHRLGLPTVLGQLAVGILLGPAGFKVVTSTSFVSEIAEIGVIFLMFIAGLESDLKLLKRFAKPATLVAVIGVFFPLVAFYGLGMLWHFSFEESCFLGVLFAATSVSISVAVLKELDQLDTQQGATILGAAVLDDILAVLLLSGLVAAFNNLSEDAHSTNLAVTLIMQLGFFVVVALLIRFGLPWVVHLANQMTIAKAEVTVAVICCMGLAFLAEMCGLSDVVGAFFAGVGIAQSPLKRTIIFQVEAVGYALFIPVFFANIGLQMQLAGIWQHWWLLVVFSFIAIATKWCGCGFGAKLAGFSWSSSDVVGAGMISRGEMALIIAEIGYTSHLLAKDYYSVMIVVVIVTTVIAPFILKVACSRLAEN